MADENNIAKTAVDLLYANMGDENHDAMRAVERRFVNTTE
jgi:hypothetical protein